MSSNKNPSAIAHSGLVGIDGAIRDIQLTFGNNLPWLEKSFGRAHMLYQHFEEWGDLKIPKCYQGEDYIDVLRNDNLDAHSYFLVSGAQTPVEYTTSTAYQKYTAPIAIIFQFNLSRLNPSSTYIFTADVLNDILSVLSRHASFTVDRIYDHEEREIFREVFNTFGRSNFDKYSRLHLKNDKAAIRIEGEIEYSIDCNATSGITSQAGAGGLSEQGAVIIGEGFDLGADEGGLVT